MRVAAQEEKVVKNPRMVFSPCFRIYKGRSIKLYTEDYNSIERFW